MTKRRGLSAKMRLGLMMSVVLFLSLFLVDGMYGHDAYAMGGGGGKNGKNIAQAKSMQVPSAGEESTSVAGNFSETKQVPEPGTLILVGIGVAGIGLASVRRKFRKK